MKLKVQFVQRFLEEYNEYPLHESENFHTTGRKREGITFILEKLMSHFTTSEMLPGLYEVKDEKSTSVKKRSY